MSGGSRQRSSKWDLREERHFEPKNVADDCWPGKSGISFHDKELEPGWLSPEVAGSNNSKLYDLEANDLVKSKRDLGLASGEPLPRSRGSLKDFSFNKGRSRNWEPVVAWDGDGSYSTKMSPGLDEWTGQSRSHSPKNGWTRSLGGRSRSSRSWSRSRSPIRGIKRESGFHERSRSRGASTQLCKDFTSGRCRRGNHCQFLHQGNQHYEDSRESRQRKDGDSKYSSPLDNRDYTSRIGRSTAYCTEFMRGKCGRGASCRYAHDGSSDGFSKGSGNDVIRERENHRNRDISFERGGEPEHRRGRDVPCKFFAAGNCRNGKYCRFSHHGQAGVSPDRRSQDGRLGPGHNSDDVDRSWDGPKWSERSGPVSVSDPTRSEDNNGKLDTPEPRFTAWSMDDTRLGHNLDKETKTGGNPSVGHKAVVSNETAGNPWMEGNAGARIGVSESRGAEKWLGDMDMSPDWNYRVQSANPVVKHEHGLTTQASQSLGPYDTSSVTRGQDITQEASVRMHDALPIINKKSYFQQNHNLTENSSIVLSSDDENAVEKTVSSCIDLNFSANIMPGQFFDQNARSSSSLPVSNINSVGLNQVATPTALSRGAIKYQQNVAFSPEGKSLMKPDIVDDSTSQLNPGIPPSQNVVSSDQLTHFTSLTTSLAQLLRDGQQIPQLYASLNSRNSLDIPSFAKSEAPLQPVLASFIQPDPAIGSQQYDPICDSIEPKKPDSSKNHLGFPPAPTGQKSSLDRKPEMPLKNISPSSFPGGQSGNDFHRTGSSEEPNHKSHQTNQLETGANDEVVMENNGVGAGAEEEESKKAREGSQNDQEDGPLENADGDAAVEEGKKSKDVKGIRAFKFALVEFVKELLKPTWKEGQISKDAYKTIVKKVVDKVTSTMQGANIPQTEEKIGHYLSSSKPKLSKLVQAYVEKTQKS